MNVLTSSTPQTHGRSSRPLRAERGSEFLLATGHRAGSLRRTVWSTSLERSFRRPSKRVRAVPARSRHGRLVEPTNEWSPYGTMLVWA